MKKGIIEVRSVWFKYTKDYVLRNINLIASGAVAILGQNGSGKTTLLRLISGLLKPSKGQILVDGKDTRYRDPSTLPVSILFQNPNHHIFTQSVLEEVMLGSEISKKEAMELLARVGLEGRENVSPYHLSEGEKKRLALAAALAQKPTVLLVDEPTSGQDPINRKMFEDVLLRECKDITLVAVTHDVTLASLFPRIVILYKGEILADGPSEEIFKWDTTILEMSNLEKPAYLQIAHKLGIHASSETDLIKKIEKMLAHPSISGGNM
ncbi:MAG: energy-coupling factor ABC transporter ATP-binding protein [Candidatus Korarchaeota archaeon]